MSAQEAQSEIDRLGIEKGDTIRAGPADAWIVEEIRTSRFGDENLVVRPHDDGDWSNMNPEKVDRCDCGDFTLNAPCYGCYKAQQGE